MKFYDIFMLPLEQIALKRIRKDIIPRAYGNVLEIGYGTGVNFKYYLTTEIERVYALDKKINLLNARRMKYFVELFEGSAEELPFENESFDTVVETLVFCSVDDAKAAIGEIWRVLKPGGIFIFIDHVKPEKERLASAVQSFNWLWHDMAGGCNLLNESHKEIDESTFTFVERGSSKNGVLQWGIGRKT
ncbi:MAG: class I SAM-dependent methyltransferase [Clostridiales bacterium]|nr:class I SAM-dependent methyltransferase [Clostridiales bacterium]